MAQYTLRLIAMESDKLMKTFRQEFKEMHVDLVDKEIELFQKIFNHLFSKRLAKIEQFLQSKFEEFERFEPEVESNRPLGNVSAQGFHQNIARIEKVKKSRISRPMRVKREVTVADFEYEDANIFGSEDFENDNSKESDTPDDNIYIQAEGTDDFNDSLDEEDTTTLNKAIKKPRSRSKTPAVGQVGRKRNPVWECFDTTFADNGKVISNDCLRCGEPVSAKAGRMRSHLTKCSEIKREATLFKHKMSSKTKFHPNSKLIPEASEMNVNSVGNPTLNSGYEVGQEKEVTTS